ALRRQDEIVVPTSLRLADAARWVAAAEGALPVDPGTWIRAYSGARAEGHVIALEAHPIGAALRAVATSPGGWAGTAGDLLAKLTRLEPEAAKGKDWPKTPRAMSAAVRRLAPALRGVGIEVELDQRDSGRNRSRLIHLGLRTQANGADDRRTQTTH